jgi:hypothetical protein
VNGKKKDQRSGANSKEKDDNPSKLEKEVEEHWLSKGKKR